MLYLEDLNKGDIVYYPNGTLNVIQEFTFSHGNVFVNAEGHRVTLSNEILENASTELDKVKLIQYKEIEQSHLKKIEDLKTFLEAEEQKLDELRSFGKKLQEKYPEEFI